MWTLHLLNSPQAEEDAKGDIEKLRDIYELAQEGSRAINQACNQLIV
jgi:hypothetical protein